MPGPVLSPCDDDLHEIRLEDEPADVESQSDQAGAHPWRARPACFRSRFHEVCFLIFVAMATSTFMVLQRTTSVMTDHIKTDLDMSTAQVAWAMGSSGYVHHCFASSLHYPTLPHP